MKYALPVTAALLLSCCGGGNDAPSPFSPGPATNQPAPQPSSKLAAYPDELGLTDNLDVPVLGEYWRAADDDRVPPSAQVSSEAPILALRVTAGGAYSTRAGEEAEWRTHEDDTGFIGALRENAGEFDFDTGVSTLQLVMCMDRNASWETYLGVLEMMVSNAVQRVYAVTRDGSALRLLDLSLPLGGVPEGANVATVELAREGKVGDSKYTAKVRHAGETREFTGPGFASSLADWVREREAEVLLIMLPRDEPFGTLFTVLNSTARLGMKSIRIGG